MIQQSNSESEELDLYSPGQAAQSQLKGQLESDTEPQEELDQQQQTYGYEIISEQQNNQVVLIKLKSDHELWHRGQILFSSAPAKNKLNGEDWIKKGLERMGLESPVTQHLANYQRQMHYFLISREEPYNGKILMLNENVYKQKFYVNLEHLLTINYESSEYTISSHPKIKKLKIFNLKTNSAPPLFITIQSSKDTAVVEKYLDVGECMFLPNARILALGQKVGCKWEPKNRLMKFTGPGFIFFQPESKGRKILSLRSREMVLANIVLVLFIIFLYLIEWYFLK